MTHLFYAKVCMFLTFCFAGLNFHQFFTTYKHVLIKIGDFKELMQEEGNNFQINIMGVFFYGVIPLLYLSVLIKANFFVFGIGFIFVKLMVSALLGIWTQKNILKTWKYSKFVHLLGKCDNVLNIITAGVVVYFLIYPKV